MLITLPSPDPSAGASPSFCFASVSIVAVPVVSTQTSPIKCAKNSVRYPLPDLVSIPGIGPAAASRLRAAVELSVRLSRRRVAAVKLDDASRIADLLGPELRQLQQETARVVLLDAKLQLIAVEEVSRGLLDQALIHSREVFAPAIGRRAYAVVLVHDNVRYFSHI